LGEVIEYLIENNHNKDDIYEKYTLDQIWFFFRKSVIIKRKEQHEYAMIIASCMPLVFGGKDAANAFQKFVNSLLPKKFRKSLYHAERKQQLKEARPDLVFQKLGIPMEHSKSPKKGKK
jgi:hypothetical protein